MLSSLQNHLADIYRADPGYDVADFLITDPGLARILGGDSLLPDTERQYCSQSRMKSSN